MRALRLMLILSLGLATLAGLEPAHDQAKLDLAPRRLNAKAPASADAAGLKGPVGATGPAPTSIYSPLPPGFAGLINPAKAGASPPGAAAGARLTWATALAPSPAPGSGTDGGAPSAAADPTDCRLSCARAYYFCLAGAEPTDCPNSWTQCLAACGKPAPVDGAPSPAP